MNKDTKNMLNAFGKASANRLKFLEEVSSSRREFLKHSTLMASGFAAAAAAGGGH